MPPAGVELPNWKLRVEKLKAFHPPFFLILAAPLFAFAAGYWVRPWIDETVNPDYPILSRVIALLHDRGLKDLPPQVKLERG